MFLYQESAGGGAVWNSALWSLALDLFPMAVSARPSIGQLLIREHCELFSYKALRKSAWKAGSLCHFCVNRTRMDAAAFNAPARWGIERNGATVGKRDPLVQKVEFDLPASFVSGRPPWTAVCDYSTDSWKRFPTLALGT
jgi:hypothetical protein